MSREKNQQLATPTGVQTGCLFTDAPRSRVMVYRRTDDAVD
jgi:hypothetical protein